MNNEKYIELNELMEKVAESSSQDLMHLIGFYYYEDQKNEWLSDKDEKFLVVFFATFLNTFEKMLLMVRELSQLNPNTNEDPITSVFLLEWAVKTSKECVTIIKKCSEQHSDSN